MFKISVKVNICSGLALRAAVAYLSLEMFMIIHTESKTCFCYALIECFEEPQKGMEDSLSVVAARKG